MIHSVFKQLFEFIQHVIPVYKISMHMRPRARARAPVSYTHLDVYKRQSLFWLKQLIWILFNEIRSSFTAMQ